ncbi:microprocessor complex subunit DGCR8 [Contarinia nasturtii]|uniref:microprocessor complex subunit DGCR8 n=1 Tax=Contarinia nasturtii TaxID=265458 RepID=UPI0012D39CEB|nr:microprocessor complex subunit DGCR8 [Contarinia nasturtii]
MEQTNTECTVSLKRKLSMESERCSDTPENSEMNLSNSMETEEENQFEVITSNEHSMKAIPAENQLQFHVLDEIQDDESGSENGNNDQNAMDSSDFEEDEINIDNLLDEQLPDDLRERKKAYKYEENSKLVLEEKGRNHFEVLPEGWIQVTHNSGLPIYMHKLTRVCSLSRPYFLGPGSLRKHQIPVSAIPCLNYKRALEEEKKLKENCDHKNDVTMNECENESVKTKSVNINTSSGCPYAKGESAVENDVEPVTSSESHKEDSFVAPKPLENCSPVSSTGSNKSNNDYNPPAKKPRVLGAIANAKIETAHENLEAQSLTNEQLIDYCSKLFQFRNIRVMRFTSWSDRRKFTKHKKNIKNLQRPTLPEGTKLITFPIIANDDEKDSRVKKEYIMNPNNKSYICILHEYVQHALKKQPTYEFKELENSTTPYSATVSINDLKYGVGYGSSKKQAKSEAARETLEVLIPSMRDKISAEKASGNNKQTVQDFSMFDEIKIEDPRVAEFCTKTTEPSPHAILLTCLQRNYGVGDIKIDYQVNPGRNKHNEFTMTVGKHKVTVNCRNKRDGKQLASQSILQILHPHITTWGSLLRLYGSNSVKSFKEKKQEEQEITVLQSRAAINQPNYAILDKLKVEMMKLDSEQQNVRPLGKFTAPPDINLLASSSNLEL